MAWAPRDTLRPFLLVARLFAWISAVIVMGITAWAVTKRDGYRVIYPLVIAVLTTAFFIPAMIVSAMKRNRGYMLPLDIVFSYLWLAAFIFLAQHIGQENCRWFFFGVSSACTRKRTAEAFSFQAFFFTLCAMCLEIFNFYYSGREGPVGMRPHAEKHPHPDTGRAPADAPADVAQPAA
ncbi:integral membrane protein [Aspergillus fumigatus A1163]|uniref:Integral membrane protein n=1 Tax=Aspergillus fumigatus (strain CBS 144.89 / FGSC A1163 / CEA10) TaxID=451804 RepID=B0XXD6_ASPFC|nr:integral membrane protein [Aspergillus fumigatus A1163]